MIVVVFIAALIIAICILKGAIWTSTLFSDARGKLGNQVVFTNWKGRTVMRAYKVPANPQTLGQQAQRSKNTQQVANYQAFTKPDSEAVALWNQLALPRQIAGFNLWSKYALGDVIATDGDHDLGQNVTITYTVKADLSSKGMYRTDSGGVPVEIVADGSLVAGEDVEYVDVDPGIGEFAYYIGPGFVFDGLVGAAKDAVQCAHWKNNLVTGVADPAVSSVTA